MFKTLVLAALVSTSLGLPALAADNSDDIHDACTATYALCKASCDSIGGNGKFGQQFQIIMCNQGCEEADLACHRSAGGAVVRQNLNARQSRMAAGAMFAN